MDNDKALQILSGYVQGCGGVLCAGWRARPRWKLKRDRYIVYISSTPPQDFKPVDGQQLQQGYSSLQQVALAMGLKPDRMLASSLTATARAEKTKTCMRAETSNPSPQDTDLRRKRRVNPSARLMEDSEAASGPTKMSKHGTIQAASSPTAAEVFEGDPPSGQCPLPKRREGPNGPVQTLHMQRGMRSSSRTNQDLQALGAGPGEQDVAQLQILAAELAPACGMHKSPVGQHTDGEMERLQREVRELKGQNAVLELQVKDQQSEQHTREEEMRAQQLAHTQIVNHLFNETKALRAGHHT